MQTRDGQEISGYLQPSGIFQGSVQVVRGGGDADFYSGSEGHAWIDRDPHVYHAPRLGWVLCGGE